MSGHWWVLPFAVDALQYVVKAMGTEVFWVALGACGTIVGLFFAGWQLLLGRKIEAYRLLRQEGERFESERMLAERSLFARTMLQRPNDVDAIEAKSHGVLGFFEDLGIMLRQRITPVELVWTTFGDCVLSLWPALAPVVSRLRETSRDQNFYAEFEFLYRRILQFETKRLGRAPAQAASDRDVLETELAADVRLARKADLRKLEMIEARCFQTDRLTREDFNKALLERHAFFFVATVLGEVVGYALGSLGDEGRVGDIDSVAVDPEFWRCRLGKRLAERLIARLGEESVDAFSLEVRTSSAGAIRLYEKLGFLPTETLPGYYSDGADAIKMQRRRLDDQAALGALAPG